MNPEAIKDQIEANILEFLRSEDFKIVSRAVNHWHITPIASDLRSHSDEIRISVDVIGNDLPMKFKVSVDSVGGN